METNTNGYQRFIIYKILLILFSFSIAQAHKYKASELTEIKRPQSPAGVAEIISSSSDADDENNLINRFTFAAGYNFSRNLVVRVKNLYQHDKGFDYNNLLSKQLAASFNIF